MAYKDTKNALATPGLRPPEKSVLFVLAHARNKDTGQCNPSIATIAQETSFNRATVLRALRVLIHEKGIVEISKKGERGNHHYRFNWPVEVMPDQSQSATSRRVRPVAECDIDQSQSATSLVAECDLTGRRVRPKQERTGKEPEEEPTRERVKGSSSPSSEKRSDLDLRRKQINVWFRNPADTAWAPQWMGELMNYASWPEENWEALADFMLAKLPAGAAEDHPLRFRRRKILSLLENLPDELAKALAWRDSQPATMAPAPDPYAAPPCEDWHALADELFQPGCTQGRDWIDLDRDSRRDLHEFFQKKTAA